MIERFTDPDSSTIAGAAYDTDLEIMVVCFKRSNSPVFYYYSYRSVVPGLWMRFKDAASHGKFFNTEIRPIYDGEKLLSPPKWAV